MTERGHILAALESVDLEPCGDNSCIFGSPGGMATNGGCRCWDKRHGWPPEARLAVAALARALRHLAAELAARP